MSVMKIGLVCPYNMFDHAGGVSQQVIHLHDGLTKRGNSVKIITPRPAGFKREVPTDYILLGTSTKFNPSLGLATAGNWTLDIDSRDIKSVLADEAFDVIHFHEPWAPILGRQILQHSKSAHVGTFHANFTDSVAAKSIVNMLIPYGRSITSKLHVMTAVSPAPAVVLINKSNGGQSHLVDNIKYIPNGIDLGTYKPFKKRLPLSGPNTKTIVFVGRLDKRKGTDLLIKAFALLKQEMPDTHLIIAGSGDRLYNLKQLVKTLGVADVQFVGFVSDQEKRRLMGNADLVCSPAMYGESFGIVLTEAMAMGTPLIAGNNIGYINVMTGHGRLGLIDAEATDDFANRLAVFLTDEAVRRLMRDWALKEVKQYDYPKVIDQYEAAYREAVKILTNSSVKNKSEARNAGKLSKISNRLFVRRHAG